MNENENMVLTETQETVTEVVAEAPAEVIAEAPVEAPKKKKRKGLKIAILVIVLLFAFAGVGAVSFFIGRNPDFDFSKLIPSFEKEEEPTEPPEFLGMWEGEGHTFCASAGKIIELDGVKHTYKWDDKTITLKNAEGEEIILGYKRTSNRLKLWVDGDKSDSIYVRRNYSAGAEKLCGSWVYGDTVISFSDMGTADIYGKTYTYTADGFEITCESKSGREYMFYTIDGEYLNLWQPGAPERKLSFIRQGSLIPQLVGTWVINNATEYVVVKKDGSVQIADLTGNNAYLYEDIIDARIEEGKLVLHYPDMKLEYTITLDGDCMKLEFASNLIGEYYRVSKDTDLSVNDVEFLWSIYSTTENA